MSYIEVFSHTAIVLMNITWRRELLTSVHHVSHRTIGIVASGTTNSTTNIFWRVFEERGDIDYTLVNKTYVLKYDSPARFDWSIIGWTIRLLALMNLEREKEGKKIRRWSDFDFATVIHVVIYVIEKNVKKVFLVRIKMRWSKPCDRIVRFRFILVCKESFSRLNNRDRESRKSSKKKRK